jgi:alpha-N-arabinofuranosidase
MKASFSTRLRFSPSRPGDEAGLLAVQSDDFYYAFGLGTSERDEPMLRIHRRRGRDEPADGVVLAERTLGSEARDGVTLRIDIDRARFDFSYSTDGGTFTTLLGDADARVLTTAVASGFIGAAVGPYAHKAISP